jgi:hypothetical protein
VSARGDKDLIDDREDLLVADYGQIAMYTGWIRGANSSASSGLGEFACGVTSHTAPLVKICTPMRCMPTRSTLEMPAYEMQAYEMQAYKTQVYET